MLLYLGKNFFSLEELHLSMNDMNLMGSPTVAGNGICSVHILHLNDCNISSWQQLETIVAAFPAVESLVAASNPIEKISLNDEEVPFVMVYFSRYICGVLRIARQ